jgi:hypothetical protein
MNYIFLKKVIFMEMSTAAHVTPGAARQLHGHDKHMTLIGFCARNDGNAANLDQPTWFTGDSSQR